MIAAAIALSVVVLAATQAFYWDTKSASGSVDDARLAVWLGSPRQKRQALVNLYELSAGNNEVIGEAGLEGSALIKRQAILALDALEKQIQELKLKLR